MKITTSLNPAKKTKNTIFSPHRGSRSLGELLEVFEELPSLHGSGVKRRFELLLAQDAKVGLKPLEVGLGVACVTHQVTSVLVALRQSDLDTVRLCEPLGILELCVQDGGSLSDPSAFAIPILDVFWPGDTHPSE